MSQKQFLKLLILDVVLLSFNGFEPYFSLEKCISVRCMQNPDSLLKAYQRHSSSLSLGGEMMVTLLNWWLPLSSLDHDGQSE